MRLRYKGRHIESPSVTTFTFKPEQPMYFTAGQFAEWTLPHDKPDNRGDRRWFTISSSPHDKFLSFTTVINHSQTSSFKQALLNLQEGDEISISQPMGDFVLPKSTTVPLLFVAGGIGITPFRSIINHLKQIGETRDIKLLYGVNKEEELIFHESFASLDNVHLLVGQPSPAWPGASGQLNAKLISDLVQPLDDRLIFISGPELMVEQLQADLLQTGLRRDQLVLDHFPNY